MSLCEYCGHEHLVTDFCTKRPKWGRRGFLMMLGAAAIGAMLPQEPVLGILRQEDIRFQGQWLKIGELNEEDRKAFRTEVYYLAS